MKAYICRDKYGELLNMTIDKQKHIEYKSKNTYEKSGVRNITSYKQLVHACMNIDTGNSLFNAAWRNSEISTPPGFKVCDIDLHLPAAETDAEIVSAAAGELVNDENSKFYMHG